MFEPTGAVAPTTKMTDIATFLQLMRSMHNQSAPKENPKTDYAFDVAPNATGKAQETDSFHAKINTEMMKWTVMKSNRDVNYHGTLLSLLEFRQEGDQLTVQRKRKRHFFPVVDTLLCLAIPAHLAWYRLLCVLDGEYSVDMRDMSLDYYKVNIEMSLRHRATGEPFVFGDWKGGMAFFTSATAGEFEEDVIRLLNLLLMRDLPHPCGVVAGAVSQSTREEYLITPRRADKYNVDEQRYTELEEHRRAQRDKWARARKPASGIAIDPSFNASLAYDVTEQTVVRVSARNQGNIISGRNLCPLSDVMSSALALYRALSVAVNLKLTVGPNADKTAVFALPLLCEKTGLHVIVTELNGAVQFHTEVATDASQTAEHEVCVLELINYLFTPDMLSSYGNVMGIYA